MQEKGFNDFPPDCPKKQMQYAEGKPACIEQTYFWASM